MTALPSASMTHAVQSALQTREFTTRAQVSKTGSYLQTHRGLKVWPRDAKFNLAQTDSRLIQNELNAGKDLRTAGVMLRKTAINQKGWRVKA